MNNIQNSNSDVSAENGTKPHVGSSAVIGESENELANKWIKELSDAGFTPDEMISVFREARRKMLINKALKKLKF